MTRDGQGGGYKERPAYLQDPQRNLPYVDPKVASWEYQVKVAKRQSQASSRLSSPVKHKCAPKFTEHAYGNKQTVFSDPMLFVKFRAM
jgi:hypothetical protein